MAKRRANGEGSIRKRKDGRWEGRYTVGHDPLTGKAISKNVLAKTQAEVTEKLQAAIAEAKKLNLIKTSQHTVDTWIHLWYNTYIKNSIRETTACYYRNYIENHIVPHIGDVPLAKLSTMQIQQMYNDIQQNGRIVKYEGMPKKPLSPRTMRGIHVLLHECLDQAVREKLLSGNPSDPVTGGMRGPDCTGRIHQKLLKKIGLSGIRFHDLRHTFATLALQNGVDVKTLSSILGHYSAGFTLDTYAHVTDQMRQDAANKMESFMLNMA